MPRNAFGAYAPPPGTAPIVPNTLADATKMEARLVDVSVELTGSLARNGTAPMLENLPMGGKRITGLANGAAGTDATTLSQVTDLVDSGTAAVATPPGVMADFAGTSPPTGWLLCFGQAVSRVTYAALFAVIGITYGAGDSSTTFNLPDCRGRVSAGKDDMGGAAAGRLTGAPGGVNGSILGGVGGSESHTLTAAQSAQLTYASSVDDPGHAHNVAFVQGVDATGTGERIQPSPAAGGYPTSSASTGITVSTTSNAGGGAHNNVQPTIIFNKIIKH